MILGTQPLGTIPLGTELVLPPAVLSSPTAVSTGPSTATGTVTTDTDHGTLFFLASINAIESASNIKAGSSQAVVAAGVQNVIVTGLAPSTDYFIHYLQVSDGSDSNIQVSAQFTTDPAIPAAGGSLGDNIRRATGGPTVNDGLATWFGKLGNEHINDAERRWLRDQGGVGNTINDLWYNYLRGLGFVGTVNDMKLQYWRTQ